jgi:hypothetical protein
LWKMLLSIVVINIYLAFHIPQQQIAL